MYPITYASMAQTPFHQLRGVPVPGIEPTSDGYVGFFAITGQQWLDFCALIEQPGWTEDESLFIAMERRRRAAELVPVIREWTTARTTAEIVEIAAKNGKAVRIGVNWGSLDQDLLTRLMNENAKAPEPKDAREVMHEAIVQSALLSAARAIEQLRLVNIEQQMAPLRSAVHIGGAEFMDLLLHGKSFADKPHLVPGVQTMLDELAWWTHALKRARSADALGAAA